MFQSDGETITEEDPGNKHVMWILMTCKHKIWEEGLSLGLAKCITRTSSLTLGPNAFDQSPASPVTLRDTEDW